MTFEYDIRDIDAALRLDVQIKNKSLIEKLNEWGKQGWEIVSTYEREKTVYPSSNSQSTIPYIIKYYECWIKRRIT